MIAPLFPARLRKHLDEQLQVVLQQRPPDRGTVHQSQNLFGHADVYALLFDQVQHPVAIAL
jgi:hypothetical protein